MPSRNSRFKVFCAGLLAVAMVLIHFPQAALAQSEGDGGKKKDKIAVWDFSLEGMQRGDGRAITNRLRSELVNSGKFQVMSRDQIETLLGEQKLGQTLIDAKEAIKAGKLKGVQFVVTGTVISVRKAFQITAEMIDGRTAEIVKSITPGTYRGDFLDFLDVEVPRIAGQLAGIQGFEPIASTPPPDDEAQPDDEQFDADGGGGSGNMGKIGIISLAAAGVFQVIALAMYGAAETDADAATTSEEYNEALDTRDTAEGMQNIAVLLGIVGAIFMIVDANQDSNTAAAGYGPGAAPVGFNVDVLPGSVMAGYALRW